MSRAFVLVPILGLAVLVAGLAAAQVAPFPTALLNDPKTLNEGRKVFEERCVFCHGKTAYPGKAPKLMPARYTPDFVYDRVTNGFRGMPPFRDQFGEEQRRAVAAYVLSKDFSN